MKTKTNLLVAGMLLAAVANAVGQPIITNPPQNQTAIAGTTVTFTVGATGAQPLTYQWRSYSGPATFTNIPFGTEATLVLTNVQYTTSRRFEVVVTDAGGLSVTSSPLAVLTWLLAITFQPTDQIVDAGTTATFTVTATGTAPFAYQWRFNDANLADKTNTGLVLANVQSANAGNYAVVVANAFGSVTSRVALLTLSTVHRVDRITANPDHTIALDLAGVTPRVFAAYYDIYPLDASSNLVDWSPLAMLLRTNNSSDALNYRDPDASRLDQRFYRTPTNFFTTPFPKPSGPYEVGTVSRMLTDPSRIRDTIPTNSSFMVTFWYPAEPRAGARPDTYVDKKITLVQDADGNASYWLSPSTVAQFVSHALPDLPLATNQACFPVLIFSHGHGGHRRQNTDTVVELASHGYVVVAMEHEDAFASVLPSGQVILTKPLGCPIFQDAYASIVDPRIKDCLFIMDELGRLNTTDALLAGRLDLERLGAVGKSFGGITVAELGRLDSRFKAVVLLDAGTTLALSTNLTQFGLQKPFLSMSSTMDRPDCPGFGEWLASSLALFAKATHDAFSCQLQASTHSGFSDKGSLINDAAGTGNPTAASRSQSLAISACTRSFFDKYLKNQDDYLLDNPALVYTNIINFQSK